MKYNLYLDDSGQLHPNYTESNHFVYGGILIKKENVHSVRARHKTLVKLIKKDLDFPSNKELKTSYMPNSQRARLLKAARNDNNIVCQVFAGVVVPKMIRLNFNKPKDVVRYKNYIIRRMVENLLLNKFIPRDCSELNIFIDQQNVAHSAKDSLEDYLIQYFNDNHYANIGRPYCNDIPDCTKNITVEYKDSQFCYLIQLSDLLANTFLNHCDKIYNENSNNSGNSNLLRLFSNKNSIQIFP